MIEIGIGIGTGIGMEKGTGIEIRDLQVFDQSPKEADEVLAPSDISRNDFQQRVRGDHCPPSAHDMIVTVIVTRDSDSDIKSDSDSRDTRRHSPGSERI